MPQFKACTLPVLSLALGISSNLEVRAQELGPPQAEREYDPLAGIAADGSIERPALPEDLPNPTRWRYTPAGRIAPGGPIDRFFLSSFISPIFFREEDIGAGGGIAITDLDFRSQRYREFANTVITASEEGQQAYTVRWRRWIHHRDLPDGGIIRDERSRIRAQAGYSRTLTRRFYGFGSNTVEGDETSYTEELTEIGGGARFALPEAGGSFIGDAGVRFQHHGLNRGRVVAIPSVDDVFPTRFGDGDGVSQLWLDAGVSYDLRDSLAQPHSGFRVGAGVSASPLQSGLDAGALFSLDASGVVELPPLLHDGGDSGEENPPTDILALGAFTNWTAGELPFYSLPSLGGSNTLRGYIQNRFTDRAIVHGSAEYRFAIVPRGFEISGPIRVERIGLAVFYDFGSVASDPGRLFDGKYLDAYGVGLRLSFAREATFRVDFGFSDEQTNVTIAFGLPF